MLLKLVKTENNAAMIIPRIIVGLVFISEGIQKYFFPEIVGTGRFAKIGFSDPEFWAYFTANNEVLFGSLILTGILVRLSSLPLLVIMSVAFVTTKYPILIDQGFWQMAHAIRTDFAMTMLLLMTVYFGAGNYSIDLHWYERLKK